MSKTIGIVGAAGVMGRDTARDLLKITDYDLILADIKEDEAGALAATLGNRTTAMRVDFYDPDSLAALCARCDVILSSTGPSSLVVDKVALAALKRGLPFVDIGGSDWLYDALTERDSEIKDKGLTYLIAAGILPGLTGTFPMYLMSEKFFDRVDSCRMYLVFDGADPMGFDASYDMLSGFVHEEPSYVWKDGARVSGEPISVELPAPFKKEAYGSPVLGGEVKNFIKAKNPGFYGLYMFLLIEFYNLAFEFISKLKLYETEEQRQATADFVSKASINDAKGKIPVVMLYGLVKGEKDGKSKTIKGSLFGEGKDFNVTASCASVYTRMLAEGEIAEKGRLWAGEAADPLKYVDHLQNLGMKLMVEEE